MLEWRIIHVISAFLRHAAKCSDSEDNCGASRFGSRPTDGHGRLQMSGKLLGSCDISKRYSAGPEKPLNKVMFLPGLCSYSHLTAEQTMTGWGGIADTSPSMCENKSSQGWRPVCLQQSWKLQ